jgi:DNA-directed RNA polymerase specialized sigma24 family protein
MKGDMRRVFAVGELVAVRSPAGDAAARWWSAARGLVATRLADSRRISAMTELNALARLDPNDRDLLAMRYLAGFDGTELAIATGRSLPV